MTVLGAVSWTNNNTFANLFSDRENWKPLGPAVPFTAPASGKVAAVLSVVAQAMDVNGCYLGVLSDGDVLPESVTDVTGSGSVTGGRITHQAIITGLTAGSAYTFSVGFAGSPDGDIGIQVNGNPGPSANESGGPVTLVIHALP